LKHPIDADSVVPFGIKQLGSAQQALAGSRATGRMFRTSWAFGVYFMWRA